MDEEERNIMGLLADLKATKNLVRIKNNGGKAKMSISAITCLITDMQDARRNLSKEKFEAVYKLYRELRTCNTKMELDINGYFEKAIDIVKKFDAIAPYEKYCGGGNPTETAFLIDEIRKSKLGRQVKKSYKSKGAKQ
jgi:hypothetical protein